MSTTGACSVGSPVSSRDAEDAEDEELIESLEVRRGLGGRTGAASGGRIEAGLGALGVALALDLPGP